MAEPDLNFSLVEVGLDGQTELIQKIDRSSEQIKLPVKTLPVGLPPILPPVEDELEKFLITPESLPIHDLERSQKFIGRVPEPLNLLHSDVCPLQTTIQVKRDPTTGKLLGYTEEFSVSTGKTAQNSMSLKRAPDPSTLINVRGNTLNFPFWPGGQDEPELDELLSHGTGVSRVLNFDTDLLEVAPGLDEGMKFDSKHDNNSTEQKSQKNGKQGQPSVMTLADIMTLNDDLDDLDLEDDQEEEEKNEDNQSEIQESKSSADIPRSESLENLVNTTETSTDEPKLTVNPAPVEEWAVHVDIKSPVDDFYKRIPDMAYKWPFEPDVFQKQAILHLENHNSVFVAAHTSAGKTVVAEYAIALSLKHVTRTIYTSPIKALSNQKYRDFKKTFEDVGLITGDVQINQTAACLIMTTEILRSMLYNGSDVIRDLEWVIFDEVHYINDAERGVVWEEVLIMLPQHVNVILLSATVPNTMEFAGWIGRTKKKKIYVISTSKRPVPLEHYLYTGNSNKTSNELFKLVDEKGSFLTHGYQKAVDAKKERASKSSQSYGAKGPRGGHPNQDKNVWLSVIDMLRKKEKLPIVAFTFSKKKIDENAMNLQSLDLTTAEEKSKIHVFFHNSIHKLKGTDQKLPQIQQMEDTLQRGIGVHHSGILPILKEVVELLFQRGLVKILFATETFAMGVNMPARTVVFDSIRKHDGTNFRDLVPGEYIQMAGRAGRRGLDTTGTVIILCKGDVPESAGLHKMMLGKPTKLESQFRLTYSMILNLLRVEQLRVEDMMKRSFSEFHSQKDVNKRKADLEELHKRISQLDDIECFMCSVDLEQYWEACRDFHILRNHLQEIILSHPLTLKSLIPGRVVVVNSSPHENVLGVLLKTSTGANREKLFTVMVICEKDVQLTDKTCDSDRVKPVIKANLFQPEGICWHAIVQCKSENIDIVTTKTLRVDADKIINDVKKREQSRFRSDPPAQSVTTATQELLRLTESNPEGLPGLDPVKDLHIRDIELVEKFRSLDLTKQTFSTYNCVNCPRFIEHDLHIRDIELVEKFISLDLTKQTFSTYNCVNCPRFIEHDLHIRDIELVEKFKSLDLTKQTFSTYNCVNCPRFIEHIVFFLTIRLILSSVKDLHIRDIELVEKFRSLDLTKQTFSTYNCVNCPRFIEHIVFFLTIGLILSSVKDLHIRDIELVEKFRSLDLTKQTFSTYNCVNCPRFIEHDLHIRDIELVEKFRSLDLTKQTFSTYNCVNCPRFIEHFTQISSNMKLKMDFRKLQFLLSDESLTLLPEYNQRVQVLKALNYIDENNAVQLKGRVACEISNHELMITELVFENALTDLHPTEIAALLSSMVFEQKRCSEPKLIDTLEKGRDRILEIAGQISKLQRANGMNLEADYEESFKFGLMEVVFEWARGMPFSDITTLTDVQEGIIVRCIQRLHETLRDVRNAARIIGDPVLQRKMEEASSMIKRDIVFAASLYTQ